MPQQSLADLLRTNPWGAPPTTPLAKTVSEARFDPTLGFSGAVDTYLSRLKKMQGGLAQDMLDTAADPNAEGIQRAANLLGGLGLKIANVPMALMPSSQELRDRGYQAGASPEVQALGGALGDVVNIPDPATVGPALATLAKAGVGAKTLAAAAGLAGKSVAVAPLGKGLASLLADASPAEQAALKARLEAEAAHTGGLASSVSREDALSGLTGNAPLQGFVARNAGENVGSAEVSGITRPNSLYRGMTQTEYDATFGSGGGVGSRGDFSTLNEGTSLADDAATAESYVNFGRDDPRKTGKPTYLVEINGTDLAQRTPDGYYKAASTIGRDRVSRVFEMRAAPDGSIVGRDITPKKQASSVSREQALNGLTGGGNVGGMAKPEYGMEHRPPSEKYGAPLHDMTKIFPDDIYGNAKQAAQYYGHNGDAVDLASVRLVQKFRNNPNAEVTIYRAVPKDASGDIGAGDWVTINKDYAKVHGEGPMYGNYKIIEKKVRAKDIWGSPDSIHEFGYHPSNN